MRRAGCFSGGLGFGFAWGKGRDIEVKDFYSHIIECCIWGCINSISPPKTKAGSFYSSPLSSSVSSLPLKSVIRNSFVLLSTTPTLPLKLKLDPKSVSLNSESRVSYAGLLSFR